MMDSRRSKRLGLAWRQTMRHPQWMAGPAKLCTILALAGAVATPLELSAQTFPLMESDRGHLTLGDLKPTYIDFSAKAPPVMPVSELVRRYTALIKSAEDPELRIRALHRLANLEIMLADQNPDGLINDELWQISIDSYRQVLSAQPNRADAHELIYQLAHAYEMKGQLDEALAQLELLVEKHPKSSHFLEAQFRIAELQYGFERYAEAERAYTYVLEQGSGSAYVEKAQYMLGWTLFKQDQHDKALRQYVDVLDRYHQRPEGELSQVERDLMEDTVRIMSVIFSYRNGAESVAQLLKETQRPQYAPLLYSRLADHFLAQQRYQDAAATADLFIEQYPTDIHAPDFALRRIEAFREGKFPAQVWPEKSRFVKRFGLYSAFWKAHEAEVRQKVEPHLKQFLSELSTLHYVKAQKAPTYEAKQEFHVAADHFRHFVEAFPLDATTGEKYFLLGEALFNAGDYVEAIPAYQHAAYNYLTFDRRSEAGYAEIIAHDKLIEQVAAEQREEWRKRRVVSVTRFVDEFPDHGQTPKLILLAANEQLELKRYDETMALAQRITAPDQVGRAQRVSRDLMRGIWLSQGNAAFELHLYHEAEFALQAALKLWSGDKARRQEVEEKLAAAVYKQGEVAVAQGRLDDAVGHFLRVGTVVPAASMRANAHYDAAMKLLDMQQWTRAIQVLGEFRDQFPRHELAQGISDKLVFAYEQNQQPADAARELLVIAKQDPDPERRRKALMQGAEMLSGAGQTDAAIAAYEDYAKRYPEPVVQAAEVHKVLATMYAARQDIAQRNRWLNGIVKLESKAKDNARVRYLAAEASWQLAQDEKAEFDAIKLTLPLKTSLAEKRRAMEDVMSWLKRANNYGVAEFATASTHLSGEVYRQLSKDIMQSVRPDNLNELELEQYNLLLEEQAFPVEERAIEFYELNARRTKDGIYDQWVKESFGALSNLVPARYNKNEMRVDVVSELR